MCTHDIELQPLPSEVEFFLCATIILTVPPAQKQLRIPHFQISILGMVSNLISAIVLSRHYVFKNAFGRLMLIHAVANFGVMLIFSIWAVPLIMFDFSSSSIVNWLNRYVGQLLVFLQEVALHACFFVSLNRFICISSPALYRKYFTDKIAQWIIAFILFWCGSYWASYFTNDCEIYFDHEELSWTFADTYCGEFMSFYIDFIYNVCLFAVIAILDIASLFMLRFNRKSVTDSLGKEAARRRRKRDLRFFVQTVATSLIYMLTLFSFDVLRCQQTTVRGVFYSGTVAWAVAHMCSGLILVSFNREIRRVVFSPRMVLKTSLQAEGTIRRHTSLQLQSPVTGSLIKS